MHVAVADPPEAPTQLRACFQSITSMTAKVLAGARLLPLTMLRQVQSELRPQNAGGAEAAQARQREALAGVQPLLLRGRLRRCLPLPEVQELLREVLRLLARQVRHPLPGLRLQVRLPLQDLPLLRGRCAGAAEGPCRPLWIGKSMKCPTWVAEALMQIGGLTGSWDEHGVAAG